MIRLLGRRVVADILDIGNRLIAVRERVGHGNWLPWLEREFGWERATADKYMRAAEVFGKCIPGIHLDACDIDATALYFLSAPGIPDEVRVEAVTQAEAGAHITLEEAERLVITKVAAFATTQRAEGVAGSASLSLDIEG